MKQKLHSFVSSSMVLTLLIIALLAFPVNAAAASGTLGSESPVISCAFRDSTGKTASGDHLKVGSYTVDFTVSGMKDIAIFQITGTYDTSKISSMTWLSYNSNFKLGGEEVSDGNFTAFLISENDGTTTVDSDGTVFFSYKINVSADGDFSDMVSLSKEPKKTFITADYGDGYYDCYVLDTSIEYPTGKTYAMTADLSPYVQPTEFDVKGKISVAGDLTGSATEKGYDSAEVSVDGTEISAVTDSDGTYTLRGLAPGEYNITITSDTTAARKATLVVSADAADYDTITVDNLGIISCDYNRDGCINITDVFLFSRLQSKNNASADVNRDGTVDDKDLALLKQYLNQSVQYTSVSLK